MTDLATSGDITAPFQPAPQGRQPRTPPARWVRQNLFSSVSNAILTIIAAVAVYYVLSSLIGWALLRAVWVAPNAQACRAISNGACWAFVQEKFRYILFGRYPYDQQWRPALVVLLLVALLVVTAIRRFWSIWLLAVWLPGFVIGGALMYGGIFGLMPVGTDLWNGLPLTLILSVFGVGCAFPLGVVLALGRRSNLPVLRVLSTIYIELIRSVPLVTVLFMASVMIPLFLPPGLNFDKLLRTVIAIIIFAAAYLAEAVRGGLQAIPKGQSEAGDALGLGYWRKTGLIILPQGLAISIPSVVSSFISTFKDTSLVIVIGLFDLLETATTAMADTNWRGMLLESYAFVGLIYWVGCFSMSRYSQHIERYVNRGRSR